MRFVPKIAERWLREFSFQPEVLPWVPFTSRTFGPPRRQSIVSEYFSRHLGKCSEVYPARPSPRSAPVFLNEFDPEHLRHLRDTIPPAYVFSLPRSRLLGSAGWIVGEHDTLLVESSFWREADFPQPFRTHFILRRKRALPVRWLPGRTLSLASDFAIGGFGHFIHDSLPRLHLIEKAGHRLRDFDWVYLPRIDTPSTRSLIAALDIPEERILQHDPRSDLETEDLVATTFPGTPGHMPSYVPEFLRTRFGPGSGGKQRRIFLSREGFRRDLANRIDVERLLLERDFEICRPHRDDAVQACSEAAVIAGLEGANLMNMLFAAPATRILMFLPQTRQNLPYAFTAAAAAGHELFVQSCPSADPTPEDEGLSPVLADLNVLAAGLDQILAAR